jgi:hypothetical protein
LAQEAYVQVKHSSTVGLGDAERGGRGDGRVDRVAALPVFFFDQRRMSTPVCAERLSRMM